MTAFACLRILIDPDPEHSAKLDSLAPLVSKVGGVFLESRWLWPRRFTPVGPSAFMLWDPRAQHLDDRELQRLAEELQLKLFGDSNEGDVALLLFEGDEAGTTDFVNMPPEMLKLAAKDGTWPTPPDGALRRLTASEEATLHAQPPDLIDASPAVQSTVPKTSRAAPEANYRGIYSTVRQAFVGSIVTASRPESALACSLVDGPDRLPIEFASSFDADCIETGAWRLSHEDLTGVLGFPVSFSAIARRSTRDLYADHLQRLSPFKKSQLAAIVYDVPRAPSFPAIAQLRQVLDHHFGLIDLFVTDPNFEVENLPTGAINVVTLMLPEAEDRVRHAAARRFTENRDAFKRHRVWPGISNVRSQADLSFCLQLHASLLTGVAVCAPQANPIAATAFDPQQLPYHALA